MDSKEEILKKEILGHYRSLRQFAIELNIPYSTLVTALDRGIDGMGYGTVIKMCEHLHLNPVDFSSLDDETAPNGINQRIMEERVMKKYRRLNREGRELILTLMDDFGQLVKYSSFR